MNPIRISADEAWISFISILEDGSSSRYTHYHRMLTTHLDFSFVKFGLLENGHTLALFAQVPKDFSDSKRLEDVHEAFRGGLSWYQSFRNVTPSRTSGPGIKRKCVRSLTPVHQLRAVHEVLSVVCEDHHWKLSSSGNSRAYTIESQDLPKNNLLLRNMMRNGIEVRIRGGTLSFIKDLLLVEHTSREVSRALRLWMMRINGLLVFAKTGFVAGPRRIVFLVRLPLEGLTSVECKEAVLSLHAAGSAFSREANALLQPDIANTYLEEAWTLSIHERR
jgi:hypothetical protein